LSFERTQNSSLPRCETRASERRTDAASLGKRDELAQLGKAQ